MEILSQPNSQVKPSINLLKLRNLAEKQKQTHAQHAHHQSTKDEVVRLIPNNAGFKMKIVDKHGSKVYGKEFTDIGQPANFESGEYATQERKQQSYVQRRRNQYLQMAT